MNLNVDKDQRVIDLTLRDGWTVYQILPRVPQLKLKSLGFLKIWELVIRQIKNKVSEDFRTVWLKIVLILIRTVF